MTDTAELLKRLEHGHLSHTVAKEAADTIRDLQAKIAEARNTALEEAADIDLIHDALLDGNDVDVTFRGLAKAVAAAIRALKG